MRQERLGVASLHVDDAAHAALCALDWPAGIINIVDRVRILSRHSQAYLTGEAEYVYGDLTTGAGLEEAVCNIDTIIHCASDVSTSSVGRRIPLVVDVFEREKLFTVIREGRTYLLCGYKAFPLTLGHVVSQYIYPV